jgi:hypothetical protein
MASCVACLLLGVALRCQLCRVLRDDLALMDSGSVVNAQLHD